MLKGSYDLSTISNIDCEDRKLTLSLGADFVLQLQADSAEDAGAWQENLRVFHEDMQAEHARARAQSMNAFNATKNKGPSKAASARAGTSNAWTSVTRERSVDKLLTALGLSQFQSAVCAELSEDVEELVDMEEEDLRESLLACGMPLKAAGKLVDAVQKLAKQQQQQQQQ